MNCKRCDAHISPFMGEECIKDKLCQNCKAIDKIPKEALAKNGLMTTDFY
jgi:hypothetical protein